MNEQSDSIISEHPPELLSFGRYVIGFLLSIGLTLSAYMLATHQAYSKDFVIGVLTALAIVQFIVQMLFFLHIGTERKPRWKLAVMFMMLGVVLILVFGSLWIMNNLNNRMSQQEVQQYLKSQDSI